MQDFSMDTIGMSLIVGGLAFLCSGLVFLLPIGRISASGPRRQRE